MNLTLKQNQILSETQVNQIIRRMAFQIHEYNFDEKQLVIVGVYDNGCIIAQKIAGEMAVIAPEKKVILVRLDVNKQNPLASDVKLNIGLDKLRGKALVIVDDVLNTGKTMAHALKAILEVDVKKLEVAVLVNRSHKLFPISAKYQGYELSTSIDEHVEVRFGENPGVYLY